jgi:hypothetical protein
MSRHHVRFLRNKKGDYVNRRSVEISAGLIPLRLKEGGTPFNGIQKC